VDKSEFKAAVVSELGVKVEDMAEAAKLDVARNEGAKEALLIASKKVMELTVHVDKDLDEGLFSEAGEPLVVARLIKKYLSRAATVLESGSVSAENHCLIAQGRLQALQLVVTNMGKIRDAELEKSKQRQALDVGEVATGRPVGTHPGLAIKEQRQLETASTKPVPPVAAPVKKQGRPKKNARNA
jgi:hypothetical protein